MHIAFATDIWNFTLHLLLGSLRGVARNTYQLLRDYVAQWRMPKRFPHQKLDELFADARRAGNNKAHQFKCTASEGLALYAIVRAWLRDTVMRTDACARECSAYLRLCELIDCFVAATRSGSGFVQPDTLRRTAEAFLDAFDDAWGIEFTTLKFHCVLHFSDFLRRFGFLVSCWSLERKHKIPKRYGTDIQNTTTYDSSLLHEVTCDHLNSLRDPSTFNFTRLGLMSPRAASRHASDFIINALGLPADRPYEILMSSGCMHASSVASYVSDIVLLNEGGSVTAAEVWVHAAIEGIAVAIVSPWALVSSQRGTAIWQPSATAMLVESSDIVDVLCWAKHSGTEANTILPAQVG